MKSLRLTPPAKLPIRGAVSVPGSKSYTNRALVLAALTPGPVKLTNPLESDDTQAMVGCLQALGITVNAAPGSIEVIGDISGIADGDYELDARLSGTTLRFLVALCAIIPGRQVLSGQPRLLERPIGDLADALKSLGADIEYLGRSGYPPVRVTSSQLPGHTAAIGGRESSQYVSALLMIAPAAGGLRLEVEGGLISRPYVDMTTAVMRQFGMDDARPAPNVYEVAAGSYRCREYAVEGDVSGAAYFFALAALTGSTVTVEGLNPHSVQADMAFLKILERMGSIITLGQREITVTGHGVKPLHVDMRDCPDQAQTLAVLAAFADGETVISGIKSLRIKETERVQALEQELAKLGIRTASTEDSLTIQGGRPRAAVIDTYNDHRMAMAFAVAGAAVPGVTIRDPDTVSKTFPGFWRQLASLGVGLEETGS